MSGSFGFNRCLRYSQSRHTAGQITKEKYGNGCFPFWKRSLLTETEIPLDNNWEQIFMSLINDQLMINI